MTPFRSHQHPPAIAPLAIAAGVVLAFSTFSVRAANPDPALELAQQGGGPGGYTGGERGRKGSQGGEESESGGKSAAKPAGRGPDRAAQAIKMNDKNGDGRVSREEWRRRPQAFNQIDANKDGYLTREEFEAWFANPGRVGGPGSGPGGARLQGQVPPPMIDEQTRCAITRSQKCSIKVAIARGLFETGLRPRFPAGFSCPDIDEGWAISYADKRDRENYHGGIDMPAPWGTPMIAAAAGTVVAKSNREESFRGMELIIRHSPEETGLPMWTYTQYAHFDAMPKLNVGDRVRMGQPLGPTGNSGRTRRAENKRRPAIHFAVWYSDSPRFTNIRDIIVPENGWWMDPNAFYRKGPTFDSAAMKALPAGEKQVPIPVMLGDGTTVPAETKVVWPYTCTRK